MQEQQFLGGDRGHLVSLLLEDRREPRGFAGKFLGVDVRLLAATTHHHDPGQAGSHDEPDDEQPHVELGVHCAGV